MRISSTSKTSTGTTTSKAAKVLIGGIAIATVGAGLAAASPASAAPPSAHPQLPTDRAGVWPAVGPTSPTSPTSPGGDTTPVPTSQDSVPAGSTPVTVDASTSEAVTSSVPTTTGTTATVPADTDQTDTDQTDTDQTDTGQIDTGQTDTDQTDTGQTDTGQTGAAPAASDPAPEVLADTTPAVPPFDLIAIASGYLATGRQEIGVSADAQFINPAGDVAGTGGYVVRYDQTVAGLPLFGGGAVVRVDQAGGLLSIATNPSLGAPAAGVQPAIDADAAAATARAEALEQFAASQVSAEEIGVGRPVLSVYDPDMIGGDPNRGKYDGTLLVWDVTVTADDGFGDQRVLVDAMAGDTVLSFSQTPLALNRRICDIANNWRIYQNGDCKRTRTEGQRRSGVKAVDDAYTGAGVFYRFFKSRFNRNGWDGRGGTFNITVRFCDGYSPCPNGGAFWYRTGTAAFADGEETDDVIGHEFVHGVINSSAKLLYYAESGAINESMADVFGELIDLSFNPASGYGHDKRGEEWLIAEDRPYGAVRSMKNPPKFKNPDRILSRWYWPNGTEPEYPALDNWGIHTNSGVNNKAAYLLADGGTFNGQTVRKIGRYKTSLLYYETLTGLLTRGSDYLDLYDALPRACSNLVRTGKLSKTDCGPVQRAVLATEMNKAWSKRRAAPKCPSGKPWAYYSANAENGMDLAKGSRNNTTPSVSTSASSQQWHSYYLPRRPAKGSEQESWVRTRYPVFISRQSDSYLYFTHNFSLQDLNPAIRPAPGANVGAVVEYSTDGKRWRDLGGVRATRNGYNGTVAAGPLKGRKAFTFTSQGFEQVRIPLKSLKGKMVQFRWRMSGSNKADRANGWYIDGVSVHTCGSSKVTDAGFPAGRFTPVTPRRLFDTRSNKGALRSVKIGDRRPGSVLAIDLTDLTPFRYGDRVSAVALNVAAADADRNGFVSAYPCGSSGGTATVNISPKMAAANSAIVPVAANGTICFKTSGKANIVADITGYFSSTRKPASTYRTINPKRVFDTRTNKVSLTKIKLGKRNAGDVVRIPAKKLRIYRSGDSPTALALSVTATGSAKSSFVTAYPCANGVPKTATVNSLAGKSVTNQAIIPIDSNGNICVRTSTRTHLVVDVTGYFVSGSKGLRFAPVAPRRAVDTRAGQRSVFGSIKGRRAPKSTTKIPFAKMNIFAKRRPVAVAVNFAAIKAGAGGYLAVWPCGATKPTTAINTYQPWPTVRASSAIAGVGRSRNTCVFTSSRADIAADVTGYFY